MTIAYIDLARLLAQAGFTSGTAAATGLSVVAAESGRDPAARHVNDDGSVDRGLWQINDRAHPDVTDDEAYDPWLSTKAAFLISKGGTSFHPWAAFTNGAYQTHWEAAKVALDGYARVKRLGGFG